MTTDYADWTVAITDMLEELVRRGVARPLRFVALGCNGAVMAGRIDDSPDGTLVPTFDVKHVPPEGIKVPVNIMWIDATGGEAVRAVIDREGVTYH